MPSGTASKHRLYHSIERFFVCLAQSMQAAPRGSRGHFQRIPCTSSARTGDPGERASPYCASSHALRRSIPSRLHVTIQRIIFVDVAGERRILREGAMPHSPQSLQVKVQTRSEDPGPVQAVDTALKCCESELESMKASFRQSLGAVRRTR